MKEPRRPRRSGQFRKKGRRCFEFPASDTLLIDVASVRHSGHSNACTMKEELLVRLLVSERVKVLAFIRSMVRRPELAEDVFQDICVLAVEKRDSIRDEAHFLNWLRTASRLRSLNVLRQKGRRHLSLDDDLLETLEVEWEEHDQEDSEILAAAIRRCVDKLAPAARGLIHRRYVEKAKYPDLAKELNRTVVGLYTTFSRIYAVLADCVSKQVALQRGEHV